MTSTSPRWMQVGRSARPDAAAAGLEAASAALAREDARLLIVFASDAYDLPRLLAAIDARSGGVPLIGCSTAGEIATSGPGDAGVVVTALGGEGFSVATTAATDASGRLREAGAEAAGILHDVAPREHRVLVLLTDGLTGEQQEIIRGAHGAVGSGVPLVGGGAGDDLRMRATVQFEGTRVLSDAVVAAAIASDAPFGIGVRHGWRRVGEPLLVTSSAGNRVYALDDEPALDVYLDRLGAPPEAYHDEAAFTQFALTHPLGLARRRGEDHARFIGWADFEQRALMGNAEVPQGALVWTMEGDADSVLEATDAASRDALAPLGDRPALGVLAFDCIARRGVLGDGGIQREIAQVARNVGGAPVAGFYTYGEIARTRGVSGFHNQTLVLLAVS